MYNFVEAQPAAYNACSATDCIPSTYAAQVYATGNNSSRLPATRVPFSPEAMQQRRAAQAGNEGPEASTRPPPNKPQAGPSRPGAPFARGPAVMPPIPQRRTAAGVDIVGQMRSTPIKMDVVSLLRIAPGLRDILKEFLEQCEAGPSPAQLTSRPAGPQPPARPPQQSDNGLAPMESVFDTGAAYQADRHAPRTENTVVKARVAVCGTPFEAIIDTGASNTVRSHSVVRKLGLMDRLEPSDLFLTAGGQTEMPMGVLRELPISLGSLKLPIDAMVTSANSYNVLLGNDFLRMAQADICLRNNTLRLRLGPEQYEGVHISEAPGPRSVHMLSRSFRLPLGCHP